MAIPVIFIRFQRGSELNLGITHRNMNKLLLFSLVTIITTSFVSIGPRDEDYRVVERVLVYKVARSNTFKAIESRETGTFKNLHVELIPSRETRDSVFFRSYVRACPYPVPIDSIPTGNQSCPEENGQLKMYTIQVKRRNETALNEQPKQGIYAIEKKVVFKNGVNRIFTIGLKKQPQYNLVFEYVNYTASFVRIEKGPIAQDE